MTEWLHIIIVAVLFLMGLRLSAFFSGAETGFYRLSLPRLGIDAQAGDRTAMNLLWFANRPSNFVATTLVGNNLANYLVTLAVTHGAVMAFGEASEWAEVVATLLISPVVFMFGELLPKHVYYRAPLARMRSQIRWFRAFYLAALPASMPLVLLTRLVERLAGQQNRSQELLPGRGRFLQMISYGHHEGLLSQAQSTLATGVLAIASQSVVESMTPAHRVLGLPESAGREEILAFARRFGTPVVALSAATGHSAPDAPQWTSYVRVSELQVRMDPVADVRRPMPTLRQTTTKLEALAVMHEHSAAYAAVVDEAGRVLGTISQRGLVEQLFRPPQRLTRPMVG
jgi:putative hemolysin